MDRGAWQGTVHGVARVGHDIATKPPTLLSFWDFPLVGSDDKESTCNVGDLGLIPGLGRSPGEGKGYPLQ